jgi:ferric-dicitrate binding protein FerR (iron transport regulator)
LLVYSENQIMHSPVTKDILFDYFAGRATALQIEMIEEWVKLPANEDFFYACLHEWELSHPQYVVNTEAAARDYKHFLYDAPHAKQKAFLQDKPYKKTPLKSFSSYWMVAASIVVVMALGAWFFRDALLYKTYSTAFGEKYFLQLSDGSSVTLNANSSLKVPRFGFGNATREVSLAGEAVFSVAHTPAHQPFEVHTEPGFKVVVLGTEFSVFARPRATRVALSKGKVQVHYQAGEKQTHQLTMKPGDLVTLDKQGELALNKIEKPENYTAWQNNRFVFEQTSLQEIAAILQENYGLSISIRGERLATQTLTGSFQATSANDLLQAISEILSIKVIRQGRKVILSDH